MQSGSESGSPCTLPGRWKAGSHCPGFPVCSDGSRIRPEPESAARYRNRTACPECLRLPAGSSEIAAGEFSAATLESLIRSWCSPLSDSILGHEKSGSQICRDTCTCMKLLKAVPSLALYLLIYHFAGNTSKNNAKLQQIAEDKSKVAKKQRNILTDKHISETM